MANQKIRRKSKKIGNLKQMLNELQNKNLITEEHDDMLKNIVGSNAELFNRLLLKQKPKEYTKDLKTFALNLNFYSPKAYKYVRETFKNCLPHPRTIAKWYRRLNCNPGFTAEAFACLKNVVDEAKLLNQEIYVNVVYDEMAIRNMLIG